MVEQRVTLTSAHHSCRPLPRARAHFSAVHLREEGDGAGERSPDARHDDSQLDRRPDPCPRGAGEDAAAVEEAHDERRQEQHRRGEHHPRQPRLRERVARGDGRAAQLGTVGVAHGHARPEVAAAHCSEVEQVRCGAGHVGYSLLHGGGGGRAKARGALGEAAHSVGDAARDSGGGHVSAGDVAVSKRAPGVPVATRLLALLLSREFKKNVNHKDLNRAKRAIKYYLLQ